MDITPIYDLRGRLRAAFIAGTNLLAEDFRLKRAVEAFAPLEKAAPVFAKVGELSRMLIEPGEAGAEGKEGILLDAITLVDAVCCTQGAVGVSGEFTSIFQEDTDFVEGGISAAVLSNVPYSTLRPLQEALTTSGSGHYSFVQECHRNNPALFKDYRVRGAMVQALGASYGELADDVRDWLLEDGADVAMLLMRDFDPRGKKEMVRRLQIIDRWMGALANDFYIKQLETAEGELRQNLILALRHSPDNLELLEGMQKTEKGNARKAVYYALACYDDEKVERLFAEMYRKKPIDVMYYLHLSQTPWAARLAARGAEEQILAALEEKENQVKDPKDKKGQKELETEAKLIETRHIAAMEYALSGKSGPEVCKVLSDIAKNTGKLGNTLHMSVLNTLCPSMIRAPREDLFGLAAALYEGPEDSNKYFPAAFLAKLIAGDGADWLDWLEKQLFGRTPALPLFFLSKALGYLNFDELTGKYSLQTSIYCDMDARNHVYTLPVCLEVKGRFLELLLRCEDIEIDGKLADLFDPRDKQVCSELEEYFYNRATGRSGKRLFFNRVASGDRDLYLHALRRCGCSRCEGLLTHFVQTVHKLPLWELEYFAREMPGSLEAKIAEASRITELVNRGKIQVSNWNEEHFMDWLRKEL